MEIAAHAPGTFCFSELQTRDMEAAKRFYAALLGWTMFDVPSAAGSYALTRIEDRDVAGLHLTPRGRPGWLQYVSVESADRSAARAVELGGLQLAAPFDVAGVGRMAMLQDPARASFALWEPRGMIGARLADQPGAPCWYELLTHDLPLTTRYYTALFGWAAAEKTVPTVGPYTIARLGERAVAGLMTIRPEWGEVPEAWRVYFGVADCDAAAQKARELGGRIVAPPHTVPGSGRFAVIEDLEGAVVDLLAPV